MCSIIGWGKGCLRFWGRLDQNSGFHGNRKPPLTYNGENDVSTFSRLFLMRSFLYLQVTGIKTQTSSISGLWFPWPIYMIFEMRFDLGTLDSGEGSLPFGLLVLHVRFA